MKDYPPYLDYPKERKKMTLADKIRAMSDEELAEWIARQTTGAGRIVSDEELDFWRYWLKEEAEVENR